MDNAFLIGGLIGMNAGSASSYSSYSSYETNGEIEDLEIELEYLRAKSTSSSCRCCRNKQPVVPKLYKSAWEECDLSEGNIEDLPF